MTDRKPLQLGIIGLGQAASHIIHEIKAAGAKCPWILAAAADPRAHSLEKFKAEFGESTWVMGYSDDMISYIPSRRVWEEGGYEGGSNLYEYGRPALRWDGDIYLTGPAAIVAAGEFFVELKAGD